MVIGATPTGEKYEQAELDEIQEQFEALSLKSAQRLLRFWQGRQAVIKAMAQKSA